MFQPDTKKVLQPRMNSPFATSMKYSSVPEGADDAVCESPLRPCVMDCTMNPFARAHAVTPAYLDMLQIADACSRNITPPGKLMHWHSIWRHWRSTTMHDHA